MAVAAVGPLLALRYPGVSTGKTNALPMWKTSGAGDRDGEQLGGARISAAPGVEPRSRLAKGQKGREGCPVGHEPQRCRYPKATPDRGHDSDIGVVGEQKVAKEASRLCRDGP